MCFCVGLCFTGDRSSLCPGFNNHSNPAQGKADREDGWRRRLLKLLYKIVILYNAKKVVFYKCCMNMLLTLYSQEVLTQSE